MPVLSINANDVRKLAVPVHIAEKKPSIRGESKANIDERTFLKIKEIVTFYTNAFSPKMYAFWAEVHSDSAFLRGIARLLWHTDTWRKQGYNVLGLLALQEGSVKEAAVAMEPRGVFFDGAETLFKEAITVAHGSKWRSNENGSKRIRYWTRLGKKRGAEPVEFDIELSVYSSASKKDVIDAARVDVIPRQWVENVYTVRDANIGIAYNGSPLKFTRQYGWLPVPGSERQFKGNSFHASLPLTPLKSSCLSVAILKGGLHPLIIHPIGLMR